MPTIFALPFILLAVSFSLSIRLDFFVQPTFTITHSYFTRSTLECPLFLAVISFFKRGHEYLKITLLLLFLVPNILLLTPWSWDMYKFFMFAWVIIAVLSGIMLAKTRRILVVALVLLSVITTASVIAYNVGTDYRELAGMNIIWAYGSETIRRKTRFS